MNAILQSVAGNPENQDRGLILMDGTRLLLCVADGAGGLSGGAEAAALAVEFFSRQATRLTCADDCVDLVRQMDTAVSQDLKAGETTFALAIVTPDKIFGASVGDSGIWLIASSGNVLNLTAHQQRKPFVGSGRALPVTFQTTNLGGILLLATDGLLKYTSADRIVAVCRQHPPEVAVLQLTELVKYPSGNFPDDVTAILATI